MKAFELQAFGPGGLRQVDRPQPRPKAGEAVVRVRAVSLNYRDLLVAQGLYNPKMPLPRIPLSDGAGEVVELGPGTAAVSVGDRVAIAFMPDWVDGEVTETAAHGALGGNVDGVAAEYVRVPARGLVHLPESLSWEEAACLPCAAVTAWHALIEGGLRAGETILTQGTGGVSLFALQIARLAGARVLITSSSDDKLARAQKLGASAGINYRQTPEWDRWAREQTAGRGVDHVIELGGAGTLPQSLRAVRHGGRVSVIGVLAGAGGEFSPLPVLMKGVRLQGVFVGSRAMLASVVKAFELHQVRPVIDRVFAFDELQAALAHLQSGQHMGKIVLRIA